MQRLQRPKNDWCKALYILNLNYLAGVSMAKVLTHHEPCFYKFNTRLGDIEKLHPKLKILRKVISYKSKMDGKTKHYTQYELFSNGRYFRNLYNRINEHGLEGYTPKKEKK